MKGRRPIFGWILISSAKQETDEVAGLSWNDFLIKCCLYFIIMLRIMSNLTLIWGHIVFRRHDLLLFTKAELVNNVHTREHFFLIDLIPHSLFK